MHICPDEILAATAILSMLGMNVFWVRVKARAIFARLFPNHRHSKSCSHRHE